MQNSQKNFFLTLISSLLFGSSLSLIVTEFLITQFGINLISLDIPGVSEKLAYQKTFDILDLALMGILSLTLFLINWFGKDFISRFSKKTDFNFASISLFIFSITAFIQTHFLEFSAKQVLIMVLAFELIYFGIGWFGKNLSAAVLFEELKSPGGKLRLQNGIFLGFLFVLLANRLTTIPALSLALLLIIPLIALSLSSQKISKVLENFPGFLLLISLFFPNDLLQLLGLLVVSIVIALAISRFKPGFLMKNWIIAILNPSLIIFLIVYNPTFYIGNFDTVEEGFWLAWIQRLIDGQILYKDAAVYHSPLIPWGMYLFSKINGFNLYSERLFLHLLQILGVIFYFFFARKVIGKISFVILALFVYLAITSTLRGNDIDIVRNNIEIRLGVPLLSLLFFFTFLQTKKIWALIVSGVVGALSLMLSIESGLTGLFTLTLWLNFFSETKFISKQRLKENLWLLTGTISTLTVFMIYFLTTGALTGFFEYTSFYAKAFSQGYFNHPMERSVLHSYFHFDVFDEYLDSVTVFWEATKLSFIGFLVFGAYKFFSGQKTSLEANQALITAFFGLLLTRAALGRSDWYHLLFVLGIALILAFYALSKLYETQKLISVGLVLFLILVMVRPSINNSFLNQQFYKFQVFDKVFKDYKAYYFERGSGALVGEDVDTQSMFELVEYIQLNSGKSDKIFVFPWNPEIYFYTDRMNPTKFDTPYAFFTDKYQEQIVQELRDNQPKFIVYSNSRNFGGLSTGALGKVNHHILSNFKKEKAFGQLDLLTPN